MKLALAYPHPTAQLLDPAVPMAGKPSGTGHYRRVHKGAFCNQCGESLGEHGTAHCRVWLLNRILEPDTLRGSLHVRNRNGLVQQL